MNNVIREDITEFIKRFSFKRDLLNSTFLITGATGLIGTALIRCLSALSPTISIVAPVRNIEKARQLFSTFHNVTLVEGNLETFDYSLFSHIDYIVHGAAPTSSKYFVDKPVETINSIIKITNHLFKYLSTHPVKSVVFLSSLEIYGTILDNITITEEKQGIININDVRSSYPVAKQLAENLCCACRFLLRRLHRGSRFRGMRIHLGRQGLRNASVYHRAHRRRER